MTQPVPVVAPAPVGSFGRGLAAAGAAALVGAIVWAIITVTSEYGIVVVGIGFLVGLAIERFGGGDARLPVAGAIIALLGCLVGDLLIAAHALAKAAHVGISDTLQHPHVVWNVYTDSFRAFDAVFYAIAAYEGFRFGQRGLRRAQAARAANQPPSIEVPGSPGPGPGLGYGIDPSAPLGSAAEAPPTATGAADPPVAQ